MASRSGISAVAMACGGRSLTMITPSRQCESSVRERRRRCAVSASVSLVYRRSAGWSAPTGSSTNSSRASGMPTPWRRMCNWCTGRCIAAARPCSMRRDDCVPTSCSTAYSGCNASNCCCSASAASQATKSSHCASLMRRPTCCCDFGNSDCRVGHDLRGHAGCWRVASQACSSSNSGPGWAEASKLDIWWSVLTIRDGAAVARGPGD